jgi:hypothetical protein
MRELEGGFVSFLAIDPVEASHAVGQHGFLAMSIAGSVALVAGVAPLAEPVAPTVIPTGEVGSTSGWDGSSRLGQVG